MKSLYETVAGLKIAKELFDVDVEESLSQCGKVGKELNVFDKLFDRPKSKV